MAYWEDSGNGPSPSRRERRFGLSGTALVLASATSGAVVYAGAVGAFTAPSAGAAALGACLIAAISARHSHPLAQPLAPLSEGAIRTVDINAPRASEVAGEHSQTDAA